ncbi:2-hydroxy-6-oxo-6-phenylhexa-2,4-dienoate hydrolase-like [Hordeum vulgare]|nr:uncharacterized protein LOC123398032 [Hordeum vulgare subsp. vulgare]KAE8808750.1 2-hydroxy-6-oxo-6-phenylhexa-2,4-dienoate hydrolase-like [Hordeum vulgare]KAI4984526.1 hypothetical protein ZWY2020_017156 [Hordeum vulgare]
MVNWVQVLRKHFVARLATNAGLRQQAVAVDEDGTVVNFWLPKKKLTGATTTGQAEKRRHAVVLVHGFAGDGMMTWGFQVGALAARGHDVYVPDLVHFGGSTSTSPDRSVAFQARCLAAGLRKLGVAGRWCTVVGFSYGGLVAFEMAAACPLLVRAVVISGAEVAYTAAMNDALLRRLGAKSMTELMLPETVADVDRLFSTAFYRTPWLPRRLLSDFLKVMCDNRKERAEMLKGMIVNTDKEASAPIFQQNILLLWGENDNYFLVEGAKRLKGDLGENVMLQIISKAGHLAHLERPCVYNRCLKEFLAHVDALPS